LGERRFRIERRVGKIGFMGRGTRLPGGSGYDAPHSIGLRIGEDKVSTSSRDIEAAASDFTRLPGIVRRLFVRKPGAVVRPATAQDAADAAAVCFEERTPLVPRGGGTSGLGGVLPVRGGVVMDLRGLCGIAGIDRAGALATVEAGAVWDSLTADLEKEGLCPLCLPASSAESTVGGWASTGGYGTGSLKYGNFHDHIESLEVALPSGFVVDAAGGEGRYSIPSFAGTEGQIGVVTKVTFSVRRVPEEVASYIVRPPDLGEALRIYMALARREKPPYSVELAGPGTGRLYSRKEEGAADLKPGDGPFIIASEEGSSAEVASFTEALKSVLAPSGGLEKLADLRGVRRRKLVSMREVMKDTPYLSGGVLMGADGLAGYLDHLSGMRKGEEGPVFECASVGGGRTLVTAGLFAGGGAGFSLLRAFAGVRSIIAAGLSLGGVPYGVGLWNSPYIDVILGGRKKELWRIKKEVDRLGVMNPGKFFSMTTRLGLPIPGWAARAMARIIA
jgi:glycolate oxidase